MIDKKDLDLGGGGADLTLLISMYNKAPYIERMVKSLAEQTYLPQTKIVIVDDASTDGSVEILKRSAEKFGVPMILRANRINVGLSLTIRDLNRSIKTPFFTVLDPDDCYTTPDRLARAVNFLKQHPDYSMHTCNYLYKSPDGSQKSAFPESIQSFSISDYRQMPTFSVAGSTFRTFYTPDLLLEIDRISGKSRFHFFDLDSFRHFCASHMGKVYFDNFLGAEYALGIGMWDRLTKLEKDVINMVGNYKFFEFSRDFFHNAQTAIFCLNCSFALYQRALDEISNMQKKLEALNFVATDYCKSVLDLESGDFMEIVQFMFKMGSKFSKLGLTF